MYITISRIPNGYRVKDDNGNFMRYYDYSKRESLARFKALHGYKGKHGITIIDLT